MTFFALNATVAYVPVVFVVTITTTAIMNIGNIIIKAIIAAPEGLTKVAEAHPRR